MRTELIKKLFKEFIQTYDQKESRKTWEIQSQIFRIFWNEKILKDDTALDEKYLIPIIQILDVKGFGGKKSEKRYEGIAYTGIFQKNWYEIFKKINEYDEIKNLLNKIFNTKNENQIISLLDHLYELNQKISIRGLTGAHGIVINDFLFAYNPTENISMVSLSDRYKIIDYFGLGNSKKIDKLSYGEKIIKSRNLVLSLRDKYELRIDNRGLSNFAYYQPFQEIWKKREHYLRGEEMFVNLMHNKKQVILYGPLELEKHIAQKSIVLG